MSKKVLLSAFKKAEEDIGSNKKTHLSIYLADILQEKYGLFINERTLRDYYTNFNKNEEGYYTELKPKLTQYLCNYLGYSNYAHFVIENTNEKYNNVVSSKNLLINLINYAKLKYKYILIFCATSLSFGFSK